MPVSRLVSFICACFLVILSGCGDSSDGNSSTAGLPGRGSSESDRTARPVVGSALKYDTAPPVNGGQAVVLEFWTQVDYESIHRRLVDDYMSLHPNVDIRLTALSWNDLRSRLYASLESEIGPDLFHMHNSMSSQLIPHLEPYPLDQFPLDVLDRDFRQIRSHVVDGRLYFIDTGLMTSAIFYNKDHWAEAGLGEEDFPRTWAELRELAGKLTVRDEEGRILRAGFNPNNIGFALLTALNLQQGMPMFSFSEPRRPLLATPESLRSLQYIRSFYTEPAATSPELPEFHESLGFGQASMIYAWGWVVNWLDRLAPETDFGTFPLPTWDGQVPPAYDRNNGEISMGVSRYTDPAKKAAAFDLIRYFLASDRYLLEISSSFGTFPSKIVLDTSREIQSDSKIQAFQQILERTVWPGPFPQVYEDHIVEYVVDPVVIDGADIRTALLTADRVLTPVMRYDRYFSLENRYAHSGEFRTEYRLLE